MTIILDLVGVSPEYVNRQRPISMRNIAQWQPTKFVSTHRGLRGSRDPKYVGVGSRYITDILAQRYELAIRAHARGRLLDMGCGHVPLYGAYQGLVLETVCVDWHNTLHANQFIDTAVDLNSALPFDDRHFDTILLTDVLEHVAEPEPLVSEIARLLRSEGKVIMGVPFFYWLHEEPYDYYRYTEHALRRFCDLNRLKVLELEPYGGLPEIFVDLALKGASQFPQPLAACLRMICAPVVALSKTRFCRRFSKITQANFPLGYVLIAQKTASDA